MVKDKVQMGFYISRDLERKFREFLAFKYQTIERGLISNEIEQALEHWIALHTKAQKSEMSVAPNPLPRVSKVYLSIKHYMVTHFYGVLEPGAVVHNKYLREAISQVRGSDERTIKKWLRIFDGAHLIKWISPTLWELVA